MTEPTALRASDWGRPDGGPPKRSRRRASRPACIGALTALALVAGCTHGGGTAAPTSGGGDPSASIGSGDAAQGEDSVRWAMFSSAAPPDMPLEPYFEALRYERTILGPGLEQRSAQRHNDVEAEVARCMAAAGFVYYPTEPFASDGTSARAQASDQDFGWLWDRLPVPQLGETRQDVAEHGYGRWEELGEGVLDWDDPADQAALEEQYANDRNAQYMESLSKSALDAYHKALDGLEPAGENTWVSSTAKPGEIGSCRDRAETALPDPAITDPLTHYAQQDLVGAMGEISWDIDNDPRTLELDREWSACMAQFGYDLPEEWGVGDSGIRMVTSGPVLAFYLAIRSGADGTVADRGRYLDGPLPKDQRSMIQSEPEKAIALADFDCRQQTDYMSRLTAMQREMEEDFVRANGPALKGLLAAIEANIAEG